jgi:3-deoxy-7-phosphoheptulonate synthase
MVIVVKQDASEQRVQELIKWIESQNFITHVSKGEYTTIIGVIGDTSKLDDELITGLDIVDSVRRVSEPYKDANRRFHPLDSVIDVSGVKVGGGNFAMIAGPCSVESEEQIITVAKSVKKSGANMLRGGAFKPRTSPYVFQGLKADGLKLLLEAKRETGLPIVTEIMNINHLPLFEDVDLVQVGARNMQNFEMLKELGHIHKPIILKRGLANTIQELLMAAEYIMAGGNENIILCERGIRTFETSTRNTLDISAVAVLHEKTHLPVVIDPSHSTGVARYVKSMAMAATAAGCDGLMIEVHNDPVHALCDGPQSITPEEFDDVMRSVNKIREVI